MAKNLELKVVLSAIDNMTAPIRGIQAQMGKMKGSYSSGMKSYNNTLKQTQNALRGLRDTQARMGKAGVPITRAMIEGEQALVRKIHETNRAIDARKTKMQQEMAIINKRQAAMSRGQSQLRSGAMNVAKAGAMGYAGYKFMQEGMGFDTTMSKVQALARLDKDSEELKALREQARDLGAKTWATATQAAEGQAFYAMAGFTPDKILKAMPATLDLAKAGDIEIGRAADIGSNMLQAFKLPADEMGRVVNSLVATFTRTNVDMEMLAGSMKYVAPVAADLGMTFEESLAMIGMLGNIGIQGDQSGTALRKIEQRLANPPSMAKKSLDELKIKTADDKGNLRNVADIFQDLFEATKNMGSADRVRYLSTISGLEASAAMLEFTSKDFNGDYRELHQEIKKANEIGEAQIVAGTMSDNAEGDIERLSSGWSEFRMNVYDVNKKGLRDTIKLITGIVNKVSAFAKANPKLVEILSKTAIAGTVLLGVVGALTMAMGIFNMVVLANPIVFVIAAIIAAIVALFVYEDEIRAFFKAFADAPAEYISKSIGWFLNLYDTVGNLLGKIPFIGPAIKFAFEVATLPIRLFWTVLKKLVDGFIWIKDNTALIGILLQGIWGDVKDRMQPVADLFSEIIGFIQEMITGIKEFFSFEAPEWLKKTGGWVGDKFDYVFGDDETPTAQALVSGAAMAAASPVGSNTQNNTISIEINAETNATPAVIGGAVIEALHGSGLMGDLR